MARDTEWIGYRLSRMLEDRAGIPDRALETQERTSQDEPQRKTEIIRGTSPQTKGAQMNPTIRQALKLLSFETQAAILLDIPVGAKTAPESVVAMMKADWEKEGLTPAQIQALIQAFATLLPILIQLLPLIFGG